MICVLSKSHPPLLPGALDDCSCSVPSLEPPPDQPGPHRCRTQKTSTSNQAIPSARLIWAVCWDMFMYSHSEGSIKTTSVINVNQMSFSVRQLLKGLTKSACKHCVQTLPVDSCWPDSKVKASTLTVGARAQSSTDFTQWYLARVLRVTCLDQSSRLLAGAASATPVPQPAALNGEGTSRPDLLPLILQQIQLRDNSQAGQYSTMTGAFIYFICQKSNLNTKLVNMTRLKRKFLALCSKSVTTT